MVVVEDDFIEERAFLAEVESLVEIRISEAKRANPQRAGQLACSIVCVMAFAGVYLRSGERNGCLFIFELHVDNVQIIYIGQPRR